MMAHTGHPDWSAGGGLRTPRRTSRPDDSRAGTGDTSCRSLQKGPCGESSRGAHGGQQRRSDRVTTELTWHRTKKTTRRTVRRSLVTPQRRRAAGQLRISTRTTKDDRGRQWLSRSVRILTGVKSTWTPSSSRRDGIVSILLGLSHISEKVGRDCILI